MTMLANEDVNTLGYCPNCDCACDYDDGYCSSCDGGLTRADYCSCGNLKSDEEDLCTECRDKLLTQLTELANEYEMTVKDFVEVADRLVWR